MLKNHKYRGGAIFWGYMEICPYNKNQQDALFISNLF